MQKNPYLHHQPDNKKGHKNEASKLSQPITIIHTHTHTKPGKG